MSATKFPPFNFFKCPSPLVPVATVDEEPTPSDRMQEILPVSEVDKPSLSGTGMHHTLGPPAASTDAVQYSHLVGTALPDLLSQLRMALLEFENTKVIHPARIFFSTWQPRYLPYPVDESESKPHLNDYFYLFPGPLAEPDRNNDSFGEMEVEVESQPCSEVAEL